MNIVSKSISLTNQSCIEIETGKLAKQADGSVTLKLGNNILFASVCASKDINPETDFLPLSVEYQEKYYAVGRFPGGFIKRESKLNEREILTSRIVDRTLRPMFPDDYHAEIQVIIYTLSLDRQVQPDALATVAASAALMASDIPFPDPVATVRVIRNENHEFIVNPTFSEMNGCDLDLMVGGTADSIVMVEGEMREVSEEVMLEALKVAHQEIQLICKGLEEFRKAVGKPVREYEKPNFSHEFFQDIKEKVSGKIYEIASSALPKEKRSEAFKKIKEDTLSFYKEQNPDFDKEFEYHQHFYEIEKEIVRRLILDENKRLDGRKLEEIRPIWCEVSYLPQAHGSAIFTRGETQSLATVTLGSKLDEQTVDTVSEESSKNFMLHYNFPPFSTGEIKRLGPQSRREVGHGNLAERSLKVVVPDNNEYTIRVVSEILESNGSSSMASVCAGCLALMDSGIQIKGAVSGIAMGLITDGEKYAILSDILGDEDHLGDMDFKTAGTPKGLTACQMDIKIKGLSFDILHKALLQAKKGREHILSEMLKTLPEPRKELSPLAPRIEKLTIPVNTIGAVIGQGGKTIQEIQRVTGTTIHIEEVNNAGIVTISSPDLNALKAAMKWVKGLTTVPEVGEIFDGKVKGFGKDGAFIELFPGKEAWLHISEVSHQRINSVEEVLKLGEEIPVKVIQVDLKTNKLRVSRKALIEKEKDVSENQAIKKNIFENKNKK